LGSFVQTAVTVAASVAFPQFAPVILAASSAYSATQSKSKGSSVPKVEIPAAAPLPVTAPSILAPSQDNVLANTQTEKRRALLASTALDSMNTDITQGLSTTATTQSKTLLGQ
jgi:hypothetical protein